MLSISTSISSSCCLTDKFLFLMICTTASSLSGGKFCRLSLSLRFSSIVMSLLFGSFALGFFIDGVRV
uniref:Uncharacterized protein n=1 Tax=Arundo donax TaxID=35708 RepID=A0A0A9CJH1_ARUDO